MQVDVRPKTRIDIWEHDTILLNIAGVRLPREDDAWQHIYTVLEERMRLWEHPPQPFAPDERAVMQAAEMLAPKIEQAWGARFEAAPEIELVPLEQYLPKLDDLVADAAKRTKAAPGQYTPGTIGHSPLHGRIIIPTEHFVLYPNAQPASGHTMKSNQWDLAYFEEAFCSVLSSVLYRQMRGEWKEEYARFVNAVDNTEAAMIARHGTSLAQRTNEIIARDKMPQWIPHVVADKMTLFWRDDAMMECYRGAFSLESRYSLRQIAMADAALAPPFMRGIIAEFYESHPYAAVKQQAFGNS